MGAGTPKESTDASRRSFLQISTLAAGLGLVASYGYFTYMAGAYLAPEAADSYDVFIAKIADVKLGASFPWTTPDGGKVLVTRVADQGDVSDFKALSDICPHLGCKVHWQSTENRFFCPCHNGTFSPDGVGTGGPPGDAGQVLAAFPLKVEKGMLFVTLKRERGL